MFLLSFTHIYSFPASDGEQLHPCTDVLVLRTRCVRSFSEQVPVVEEVLDNPPAYSVYNRSDSGHKRHSVRMRLPSLDAVRTRDLHALFHRPVWKLLRQSLHRKGQFLDLMDSGLYE